MSLRGAARRKELTLEDADLMPGHGTPAVPGPSERKGESAPIIQEAVPGDLGRGIENLMDALATLCPPRTTRNEQLR